MVPNPLPFLHAHLRKVKEREKANLAHLRVHAQCPSAIPAHTVRGMGTLPESVVNGLKTKNPNTNAPLKHRMLQRYMTMNSPYS
jgi:hypothetical protein